MVINEDYRKVYGIVFYHSNALSILVVDDVGTCCKVDCKVTSVRKNKTQRPFNMNVHDGLYEDMSSNALEVVYDNFKGINY